jgi:hypothetical protein
MRYLRLLLVLIFAYLLRGAVHHPSHFDLSRSYSSRLGDRTSVDKVTAQLNAWEHELRAHGFNNVSNGGGFATKTNADGKEERTESHDLTLVGKLDNLGHVQVRIRTDQNLDAPEQAEVDLQAQKKKDYAEAWSELGEKVRLLLQPH